MLIKKYHSILYAICFLILLTTSILFNTVQLPQKDFISFDFTPYPVPMINRAVIYTVGCLSIIINEVVLASYFKPSKVFVLNCFLKCFAILSVISVGAILFNFAIPFQSNYYMFDCIPIVKNEKFIECLKSPSNDSFHALFNLPIIVTSALYIVDCSILKKLYDRSLPALMSLIFKVPWICLVIYSEIVLGSSYIIIFASLLFSFKAFISLKVI